MAATRFSKLRAAVERTSSIPFLAESRTLKKSLVLSTNLSPTGPTGSDGQLPHTGTLIAPFTLVVSDQTGKPVAGATLAARISDPSGSVFLSSYATDANGKAQVSAIPGNSPNETITLRALFGRKTRSLRIPLKSIAYDFASSGGNLFGQGSTYILAQFNPPGAFTGNSFRVTVIPNTGADGTYYNAGSVQGAYFGLQQCNGKCPNGDGTNTRQLIFSAWNNGGETAQAIDPGKFKCIAFGGEGTGVSCTQPFEWVEGDRYRFVIQWAALVAGSTDYTLSIQHLNPGESPQPITLGTLRYPGEVQNPPYVIPFVEDFARTTDQCTKKPVRSMTIAGVEAGQGGSWLPILESAAVGFRVGAGFPDRTAGCALAYGGPSRSSPGWDLVSGDSRVETNPFSESPFGIGDLLHVQGSN